MARWVAAALALLTTAALAEGLDTVRLKSGGVLRGSIVEGDGGKGITIRLLSGRTRTVQPDEVAAIERAAAAAEKDSDASSSASSFVTVRLTDGSVVRGLLLQNDSKVVLRLLSRRERTWPKSEIASISPGLDAGDLLDAVRLKDGTILRGSIVSKDKGEVSIKLLSGRTRTLEQSELASVEPGGAAAKAPPPRKGPSSVSPSTEPEPGSLFAEASASDGTRVPAPRESWSSSSMPDSKKPEVDPVKNAWGSIIGGGVLLVAGYLTQVIVGSHIGDYNKNASGPTGIPIYGGLAGGPRMGLNDSGWMTTLLVAGAVQAGGLVGVGIGAVQLAIHSKQATPAAEPSRAAPAGGTKGAPLQLRLEEAP